MKPHNIEYKNKIFIAAEEKWHVTFRGKPIGFSNQIPQMGGLRIIYNMP